MRAVAEVWKKMTDEDKKVLRHLHREEVQPHICGAVVRRWLTACGCAPLVVQHWKEEEEKERQKYRVALEDYIKNGGPLKTLRRCGGQVADRDPSLRVAP